MIGKKVAMGNPSEDPLPWLLEKENPCVRHRALTSLLDKGDEDPEVFAAMQDMISTGPIAQILSQQQPEGCWGRPQDFYMRSKYKGTVWNIIMLGELGCPHLEATDRAGDFIVKYAQRPDGGFTYLGGPDGGRKGHLPCLTANMVFSLTRMGYAGQGMDRGVDALLDYVLSGCKAYSPRCDRCRSGRVKALKAFLELPQKKVTRNVRVAIASTAETILGTCLAPDGPHERCVRPEWKELGFPHMWETDLLEMLGLVAKAGRWDTRTSEAFDIVMGKRGEKGRWSMERSFNGRFLVPMERRGRESKWLTLKALELARTVDELPDRRSNPARS
ncbi:MAG TPA: hypothetical protein VMB46_05805 [Methanomassiliicoccales archaeon]|nr:hypothetical protein [Methanomassiliicoccales archaeon]